MIKIYVCVVLLFVSSIAYSDGARCFLDCKAADNYGYRHYYYCCNLCGYWEDEGCESAPKVKNYEQRYKTTN